MSFIDFTPLLKALPRKLILRLPPSELERLSSWAKEVRSIKHSDQTRSEKRKALEALPVPSLISDLLKNHLAAAVENKSHVSKETARNMLDRAGKLTQFVGMRTFIALNALGFGVHKLMPRYLMSDQFDHVLTYLEETLSGQFEK